MLRHAHRLRRSALCGCCPLLLRGLPRAAHALDRPVGPTRAPCPSRSCAPSGWRLVPAGTSVCWSLADGVWRSTPAWDHCDHGGGSATRAPPRCIARWGNATGGMCGPDGIAGHAWHGDGSVFQRLLRPRHVQQFQHVHVLHGVAGRRLLPPDVPIRAAVGGERQRLHTPRQHYRVFQQRLVQPAHRQVQVQ